MGCGAALWVVLFCLFYSVLTQPSATNNNKYSALNHIDGSDQMCTHAQSHSNHDGEMDFRLPSGFCTKSSGEPREMMWTGEEKRYEETPRFKDISRNEDGEEALLNIPVAGGEVGGQSCKNPTPSATFVTALYDIGRGDWAIFPRPYSIYLNYFRDVLKLNINLVVFVEESDKKFVLRNRRSANMTNATRVWTKPFEDLAFHKYLPRVRDVVESEDFRANNDNLRHPEGFSPEYIILMNSKFSLLQEVAEVNPFCSSHFVWIDAGYGHGKNVLPQNGETWVPRGLIDVHGKITIIQLERPILYEHYDRTTLFKMGARPAFIGGFFGGDSASVNLMTALHEEVFTSFLDERLVHEDQMMMLMCYLRKPEYFNPVEGWWYDGYKLFH
ncbi:protein HtrL-like isoform X2 [Liolophura sinensis]|uniref:protein HtrL-like isoform X2 n=1 Tax=Liolophura sinensis TaxID=3198878 RepID=UPI00315807F8